MRQEGAAYAVLERSRILTRTLALATYDGYCGNIILFAAGGQVFYVVRDSC